VAQLLPLAYSLLKRNLFAEVIEAHLADRRQEGLDRLAPCAGVSAGAALALRGVGCFIRCVLFFHVETRPRVVNKAFLRTGRLLLTLAAADPSPRRHVHGRSFPFCRGHEAPASLSLVNGLESS